MNNTKVDHLLEVIGSWSKEAKALLLEKLIEETSEKNVPHNPKEKLALLNELCGAWADTSDSLAKEILDSRTSSSPKSL